MGTNQNDFIAGTPLDDEIWAKDGDDTVLTKDGNDIVGLGAGDDEAWAGNGMDEVFGGAGNDTIGGGGGDDTLYLGAGDDTGFGGVGNDVIGTGAGNDTVWAGSGNDTVYGADGDDVIGGGKGNDLIWGGDGDDTIYGGEGNDTIAYEGDGLTYDDFTFNRIQGGYEVSDGTGNVDRVYGIEKISINGEVTSLIHGGGDDPDPFDPGVITRNPDGTLHDIARDGDETLNGDGNDPHNFSLATNETRGKELGLQIKKRGGESYDPVSVDADGTVHWEVPEGEGSPGRAEWSWDYSFASTNGESLTDYEASWFIDRDPTEGVDYIEFVGEPGPSSNGGAFVWEVNGVPSVVDDGGRGDGFVSQNSQNLGFYEQFIDMDPNTDGIQPYDFSGGAEFDVLLQITDGAGNVLLENHGVVHVMDDMVI